MENYVRSRGFTLLELLVVMVVIGVLAAMKYFFPEAKQGISRAEIFFLVERVANSRSLIYPYKIAQNIQGLKDAGLLTGDDIKKIFDIYNAQLQEGRVRERMEGDRARLDELVGRIVR